MKCIPWSVHRGLTLAMRTTFSWLLTFVVAAPAVPAQTGPTYSDPHTREIVERMVEAHGGLAKWTDASSFQFTAGMYLASLPVNDERTYSDNWRYYRVTIEPRTSRGIVELPLEGSGPVMGYDGNALWSRNYSFDPSYQDGPFQLLFMHYGWITLPWLTQQSEVTLTSVGTDVLPGSDVPYHVVEMTFQPENKQHGGFFRLFIDPETSMLGGFTQTVPYPYLPGDVIPQNLSGQESTGGVFRIIDGYAKTDGLVVPQSYYTIRQEGDDSNLMGAHLVIEPSFHKPLDPQWLQPPNDGRILLRKRADEDAQYRVTHVGDTPPQVDGHLDDATWDDLTWSDKFSTPAGGDPTQRTAFALTHDDTYLYLALRLNDESPDEITRTPGERDDTNGDRIAAFFDTNVDGVTTKVFVINAAGVVRDQTSTANGTQWDNDWDTEWTAAHSIDEGGWSAEFRIPFASLGLEAPAGGEWGFQLTRVVERLSEQSFWSRLDPAKGFVGSFGRIQFTP